MPAPTLRRWVQNGDVTAFRLSEGGHRRVPYDEVVRLSKKLDRESPPLLEPIRGSDTYRVEDAAEYLGVSARFLRDQGLSLSQGGTVTGADILGWEALLYTADWIEPEGWKGEIGMPRYGMHHHAMGRGPDSFGMHDGPGFGPWEVDWDDRRPHSVLWLRSMKRHLEARKADIEDRLEWVEDQLNKAQTAEE
ncbi:MAG: excisionase [Thermaerobacter sp.]|nr:excisionase [Thermaerobacter sp.]